MIIAGNKNAIQILTVCNALVIMQLSPTSNKFGINLFALD